MIDPNNANNLNPQNVNNNISEPIDPSFLPKDSNVYIRTMNTDLTELKSRGGEALPYVETPASINNMPSFNNQPEIIKPTEPTVPKPAEAPAASVDFSNIATTNPNSAPLNSGPIAPPNPSLNDVLQNTNTISNNSTLEGIKSKINELNNGVSSAVKESPTSNLSANLNDSINKLISPEEFSPMSNVDLNPTPPKGKNKLFVVLVLIVLLISLAMI